MFTKTVYASQLRQGDVVRDANVLVDMSLKGVKFIRCKLTVIANDLAIEECHFDGLEPIQASPELLAECMKQVRFASQ